MARLQDLLRRAWRWFATPPAPAVLWKRMAVALWLTPPIMFFPLLTPSMLPAILAEYWLIYALFFGLPFALGAWCWRRANHKSR